MFFNTKATLNNLTLSLDIDSQLERVNSLEFSGNESGEDKDFYRDELDEIKTLTLGKSIHELKLIKRGQLKNERLIAGKKAVSPMGLFLLREALAQYLGEDRHLVSQKDLVCLCFAVTRSDIKNQILADKNFDLKMLITKTHASSACGSCKNQILELIEKTRVEHGLIKGLDHSRSRFDSEGKWLKVNGLFPGPLLIKIEKLKTQWMEREGIVSHFFIEITNLEGYHVEVVITSKHASQDNDKTFNALCLALSDYLKKELGVQFFIQYRPHHH